MRATPFANTSSTTSVLHASPSQTPVHAPANRARSAGTFVPGDVSLTSAGSGVSRTQSLACAGATSSAVARMAMAPPAITRDRSPPIACRCGPGLLAEESIGRGLVLVRGVDANLRREHFLAGVLIDVFLHQEG